MDNAWTKTFKNFGVEAKRAAERTTVNVMKKVGLSNSNVPETDPQFEYLADAYINQSQSIRALRADIHSSFEAIARTTGTAHSLAVQLHNSLPSNATEGPRLAADALLNSQAFIADKVLARAERRVKKRLIAPADEELSRVRDVAARMETRKKIILDAQRYRARVSDAASDFAASEDSRKAEDKLIELASITNSLTATITAALPRRAAFVERAVAETIEFQRRFYQDAALALDRAVESVGPAQLDSLRASTDDDIQDMPQRDHIPPREHSTLIDDDSPPFPKPPSRSNPPPVTKVQSSIWDEEDDDESDPNTSYSHIPDMPPSPPTPSSYPSSGVGQRESSYPSSGVGTKESTAYPSSGVGTKESTGYPSSGSGTKASSGSYPSSGVGAKESVNAYPSSGIGAKESVSGYPTSGVGQRESTSSYPSGGSRQRENIYPTAKTSNRSKPPSGNSSAQVKKSASRESGLGSSTKPNRPFSDLQSELLGAFDTPEASSSKPTRPKKSAPPAAAGFEDFLDLSSKPTVNRSTSASAAEGDLLGAFGAPSSNSSRTRNGASSRSRQTSPGSSSPSLSTNRAPAPRRHNTDTSRKQASSSSVSEGLEREELRLKHEAEIKARADEKLAAVRERENAEAREREQKDNSRSSGDRKINQWTGNGARRGNLRALLASLDTVLYPGATWTPVSMEVLKANPKVKINYHKAILQVHPDKVGSKNLPADQQVLAELIFDELKNGYEVWTAEQDGRPPPPGSVGPKGAPQASGGFGNMNNMNMSNMYNMSGMGRGGMGMGGRGGMGMGGMAGRGGMGMGGMGRGFGSGMGGRGTGMGNMPYGRGRGYGNGMNQQRR